jgi:hypothetical protein
MTETITEEVKELPELKYSYQPTDEFGVNMGGPQVIKYKTTDELIQKLQENNVRLQRKLREANRKNKTGQLDPEDIPSTSPRFTPPVDFNPESLTADELIEISKQLGDPSTVQKAYSRLAQATFGAPVEKVREAIQVSQKAAIDNQIRAEVDSFLINNPDYYICKENYNTICNWMERFNLEPIEENFTMAYKRLSAEDILLTGGGTVPGKAPVSVQPIPAKPVTFDNTQEFGGEIKVEPVEIVNFDPSVSTPPPASVQRITTALTNSNTSISAPPPPVPGSDIVYVSPAITDSKGRLTNPSRTFYGMKALDAMPVDEYEKRFRSEPGFKEKVDKLLSTRKVNPNQR